MARGIYILIAIMFVGAANAASVRGASTASRGGTATAQNQMANPASSYTYNYMYPYLNNQMRTTLRPTDPTSPSTSPINAIVRTEPLSAPRRVVPRPRAATATNATPATTARAAKPVAANSARRVVARPRANTYGTQSNAAARNASRVQGKEYYPTENSTYKVASSSQCLADYAKCMNAYCERADTAYNRCYCSAKLAQIDATYQPQIDSLVKQIIALQNGNQSINNAELNEYWTSTVAKYTGDNSWTNMDDALNIDWASMESRVRGQNAFITGHEYCAQHIAGCFYMANNLRDAYLSTISRDCATYESGLERLKTVAESVIEAYRE